MSGARLLRVLIVEDNPADAELMVHELQRAGFAPDARRVDTERDYLASFEPEPDVILADYGLPRFDLLLALQLLHAKGLGVPFIVVTGSIGDEAAAECIKRGAADYVLKHHLERLGSAVWAALDRRRPRAELDASIAIDPQGSITEVNGRACTLAGRSRADLIGRPFGELFTETRTAQEIVRRALAEALVSGYVLTIRSSRGPGATVSVSAATFRGADGRLRGVFATARDITEQTRMQRELRDSEQRFRLLLEAAPAAMVIAGADGRIVIVNAQLEALFGYRRDELLGQPVEILLPERFRARHVGHRAAFVAAPRTRLMEAGIPLWARRKDGSEFPAEISLSPMETGSGLLVSAAIRDVTAHKRLEEELREHSRRVQEANRLKSEFLANMSHELRTPLNGIIGFTELMHDGKLGPISDDQKEYLGDILASSRHLIALINDVLDLAKVEAGKIELRTEAVDVASVIAEVRDSLRPLAAEKRIRVEIEVGTAVRRVVVDPAKLKQILYNYVSNALKFTAEEGRVTIRARPEDARNFRLEVEDTGIGIRADDIDRLFVEFQQLDAGAAKKYPGTGLGLALTRRLAEAHGGRVGVQSVHGRGSVFFAVLPIGRPEA